MEFEWNEDKRKANLDKHGVDFLDAALIFEGTTVDRIDDRFDYGEVRWVSMGMVDATLYVIVYTEENDTIRIISAWKASKRERREYEKSIAQGD